MGYEQVAGMSPVTVNQFWAGWFPGKTHFDIPGTLAEQGQPIGSPDCNNVIYYQGKLRRFPGYTAVNSSALEGGATITSLFYSPVLNEFVGTVGTKLYKGMSTATPTNITGTATISSGVQVHFTEWQFTTTKLVVGVQQGVAPFKWTGTGNASNLGGTPPQGKWIINWRNALWIASTATEPSTVFFSNLGDPETWSASDNYKFDAPITGLGVLGDLIVVFMEDHIGVMSGNNNRLLTKIDRFINGIGCTGGFTVSPGKIQNRDVLIFHAKDGFYAFDGSREIIKLSSSISNKYTTGSGTDRWNEARWPFAWGAYFPETGWYAVGLADGVDTQNGFLLTLDMARPFDLPNAQGLNVPHWPCSDQPHKINCITVGKDVNGRSSLYFGSTNGFIYKYAVGTLNRNGSAFTCRWKSKIFDLGTNTLIYETNILGDDLGNAGQLDVFINYDQAAGDGESDTEDMSLGASQIGVSFILGVSALGGQDFVFKDFDIANFGRFFQWSFRQDDLNHDMRIQAANFVFKNIGLKPNAMI